MNGSSVDERGKTHHGKSNLFQETPKPLCSTFLPTDVKHCLNVGYTFVNFTTSEAVWKSHVCITRKSWPLFKSKKIAQVVRAWIQSKNSLVKHFEDMRLCRPSKEYLPVWFDPPRDESMSCLTTKGMHTIGAVCARMSMSPTSREHEPCGATSRIPLLNLSGFISDQAKEIKLGRSQVNKPRSKLYLVSKQFQSISETVSLQQDSRRAHSKKIGWHKALYPNKGGKIARRIIQFKRVPLTNGSKVSTDEQIEGTDKQIEGTDEQIEGTEEQRESTEDKVESTAGQIEGTEDQAKEEIATQASQTSTQTPTSMIFCVMNNNYTSTSKTKKNHEPRPTSTRSLLTLKPLPKIDPKDKGKKKIEEEDESGISEDDDIPQAVKKFKQLESDDSRLGKLRKSGKLKRDKMNCEEEATNEALIKII
ncbi:MEI2-like protein 6 [Tanacetum coccineum]